MPGPAAVIDLQGNLLLANRKFQEISGFSYEPDGMPCNILTTNSRFQSVADDITHIREGLCTSAYRNMIFSSSDGLVHCYRMGMISFLNDDNTTNIFISGCDITAEYFLSAEQNRINTLYDLIREIIGSHLLDQYPEEQIQQMMSRVGAVMKVRFSSYIEMNEISPPYVIIERFLWSDRYGYLIGTDMDDLIHDPEFFTVIPELKIHHPVVIRKKQIGGFIRRLLEERACGSLVMVPLIRDAHLTGILILWDESETRRWMQVELTTLMILAGIIETKLSRRQIEGILARSEQKFQNLIDQIGDMYFMTDKSGLLIRVSSSLIKNLGYQSDKSLIGTSLENIVHPPEFWPVFLSDIISGEGVKDYEIQLITRDQKIIYSSISCRLVYDDDGVLQGIEGVIRDITRRKQYGDMLSDIEWKLEQAQKIARMGVWSYDNHLRHFRVSPEVFSLLGTPPDQNYVVIDDFISRTYQKDQDKFLKYFQLAVSEGKDFDFEFRISFEENRFKYLRIMGKPLIKNGMIQGSYGILQDITERKDVENHLMKYATELEEKTMELDAMRTQLLDMNRDLDNRVRKRTAQIEELLRQKDEFIQIIGHDLKTPLTPLVAILPYIRKKITDPELGELLDNSIEDVATIRKLVTTILDLAQMNSLYMLSDLQEIHIRDMVNQIISDNAYLIHQKSLHVVNTIPDELSLYMSPMHFETVLGNLIGNAVKYSYINGNVTIHATDKEDSILISIQDEGIGIEPEHIPRIFDEFYRADNSRHDRGSHGLGLAIAKRVVEMYHGTISVTSEGPGKGSVFYLHLKKNPEIFLKKRIGFIGSVRQRQGE